MCWYVSSRPVGTPARGKVHLLSLSLRPAHRTRRASWALVDQALTSVGNLLLAVVVARRATASQLGALGVVLAVYVLALVVARAYCGEPLLLGLAEEHEPPGGPTTTCSAAAGAGASVGVALAFPSAAVGLVFGGSVAEGTAVLALALPFLVLQDTYRLWFFSREEPHKAAALDALWLVLQIVSFYSLVHFRAAGLNSLLLAWGAAAAASSLLGRVMTAQPLRAQLGRHFLRGHADKARLLAADSLLALGPTQVALILVAAVVALKIAGTLRAGLIVLGPVSVVAQSISYSFIPPMRRRIAKGQSITRPCALVALLMAGIGALWVLLVAVSPIWLGVLLGRGLSTAQPALFPLGIYAILNAASLGPMLGMRVLLALKSALVVRCSLAPVGILAPVVGGLLAGAPGAGWGCAVGGAATLIGWTVTYRATVRAQTA